MRKRTYVPFLLATGCGATLGLIDRADAHTPRVTADCRVLQVELTDYEPSSTVTIVVDDATSSTVFAGAYRKSIPWTADRPHTWKVVVDNRGDGLGRDEWDETFAGSSSPCVTPTTTQAPPTTTTAAPVVDPPVVIIAPLVESRPAEPVAAPHIAFTG